MVGRRRASRDRFGARGAAGRRRGDARDGRGGGGVATARSQDSDLATTNDNSRALNFYIKRGYRLVRLHLDAMDRVRALKPGVPLDRWDGVPLQDMWELEKTL